MNGLKFAGAVQTARFNSYTSAMTFGLTRHRQQKAVEAEEEVAIAQEERAMAIRQAAKKVEYKVAKAERPWFDYIQNRISQPLADSFSHQSFGNPGNPKFTGKELLQLLMTPETLNPQNLPSPDNMKFQKEVPQKQKPSWVMVYEQVGQPESLLRTFAQQKEVPYGKVIDALYQARNYGLIYQVIDRKGGGTFYGVPQTTRNLLQLTPPKPETKAVEVAPEPSVNTTPEQPKGFALQVLNLITPFAQRPPKDEFFEYARDLGQASVEAGVLPIKHLPRPFMTEDAFAASPPPFNLALLTLFEASQGTRDEAKLKGLCLDAVTNGYMTEAEYDETVLQKA